VFAKDLREELGHNDKLEKPHLWNALDGPEEVASTAPQTPCQGNRCEQTGDVGFAAMQLMQLRMVLRKDTEETTIATTIGTIHSINARSTNTSVNANRMRKKIAFMTMISSDPGPGKLARLDGAGVLAESIRTHMGYLSPDLIAIVSSNVSTSRPILKKFGWQILQRPLPDLNLVRSVSFRREVRHGGYCGYAEMLKLEAYRMIDYDRVVVMDTDMLVHDSFEELFNRNETTIYTAPFGDKAESAELLQGAFLVIRPNVQRYDEIMDVWYGGNFSGQGWNLSGIGYYYGGSTVQGILPFFWKKVHPEEAVEVDQCVYNNNAKDDHLCPGSAKVSHFTICQKPWYCLVDHRRLCSEFTRQWWKVYRQTAKRLVRGNVSVKPCERYVDGLSSAYPPLLPESKPVTDGW